MQDTKEETKANAAAADISPSDEPVPPPPAGKKKGKKAKAEEKHEKLSGVFEAPTSDFKLPGRDPGAPEWLLRAHGTRLTTELVAGLSESIDENGVQKTIVVWDDRGIKWILDGVQRYRGLEEANKMRKSRHVAERLMPYKLAEKGMSAAQLFKLTMQLNGFVKLDSQLERSEKAAFLYKLARDEGMNDTKSQELVAEGLGGISTASVHNYLVMNTATPKIKKLVQSGEIAASVAMEIAHLPQAEQEIALEEARKASPGGKKPTTAAAKGVVKARQGKITADEPVDKETVRKMIAAHIEGPLNEIDKADLRLMRFCLGHISAKDAGVKGLTATIQFISAPKREQ